MNGLRTGVLVICWDVVVFCGVFRFLLSCVCVCVRMFQDLVEALLQTHVGTNCLGVKMKMPPILACPGDAGFF